MYKLLLTDLDDTLLNSDGKISIQNKLAIQKAIEKGCQVAICSGRSNMSIAKFNEELGIKGYTIGYNGGIIYKGEQVLSCHYLNKSLVEKIILFCRSFDVSIQLYQHNKLWIDKITPLIESYCKRSVLTPVIVDDLINHLSDEINKVIILSDYDTLKLIQENLKEDILDSCCTFFSSSTLFEFNPINITKGSALIELADKLNIPINQIIAIGDNENDIPMIKSAGLGIAVKNSIQQVKENADYITVNDNNNNAIAEIINKFILEV